MVLSSVWSRAILAYFMPNYVITIVWISLLYDALMLLVWFWSVPIIFWNPMSNLTFWVQKNYGQSVLSLLSSSYSSLFSLHTFAWVCALWLTCSVCMFSYISAIPYHILMKFVLALCYAYSTSPAIFKLKLPYKLTLKA